ncbi:MAG: cyclic nucleotide-binding domain-containing protein [Rhodocyclaceae bacterium]|nr:cyclic nucleotide-binding domain-containing protein [Rhodocyclaceae bacterium]
MLSSVVSVAAIRTFALFKGLDDDVLERFASVATMRQIKRGQAIMVAGDDAVDGVYFMLTGNAKVVVNNEDGREVILCMIGQGEFFGEMSMFDEQPRSASVVAVNPSTLVVVPRRDFCRLLHDSGELSWRLLCKLSERLRLADRKIESLALMDVYGRVARLLLDMAEETEDKRQMVREKVSKQDIARMIGASREMVSRVMKDLLAQGLIEETHHGIELKERLGESY